MPQRSLVLEHYAVQAPGGANGFTSTQSSYSRTQTLYSRMASYIASGARSAPFGH